MTALQEKDFYYEALAFLLAYGLVIIFAICYGISNYFKSKIQKP